MTGTIDGEDGITRRNGRSLPYNFYFQSVELHLGKKCSLLFLLFSRRDSKAQSVKSLVDFFQLEHFYASTSHFRYFWKQPVTYQVKYLREATENSRDVRGTKAERIETELSSVANRESTALIPA